MHAFVKHCSCFTGRWMVRTSYRCPITVKVFWAVGAFRKAKKRWTREGNLAKGCQGICFTLFF